MTAKVSHAYAGRQVGVALRSRNVGHQNLHEARSTCNHDIPDAFTRLELGGACENRRLLPDVRLLKVAAMAIHGA